MLKDVEYLALANLSYYDWSHLTSSEDGRDIIEKYSVAKMLKDLKDLLNPLGKELTEISEEREEVNRMKMKSEERLLILNQNNFDLDMEKRIKDAVGIYLEKPPESNNKEIEILEKEIELININLTEQKKQLKKLEKKEEEVRKLYQKENLEYDEKEEKSLKTEVENENILNDDFKEKIKKNELLLKIIPRRQRPNFMAKLIYEKELKKDIEIFEKENKAIFFFYSEDKNKQIPLYVEEKSFLSDWKVISSERTKTITSFQGVAFKKDNNVVISLRGTEFFDDFGIPNFTSDALTDGGLFLTDSSSQRYASKKFVDKVIEANEDCTISIVGHSLGGALANYTIVDIEKNNLKKVKSIVTFNGLGIIALGGTKTVGEVAVVVGTVLAVVGAVAVAAVAGPGAGEAVGTVVGAVGKGGVAAVGAVGAKVLGAGAGLVRAVRAVGAVKVAGRGILATRVRISSVAPFIRKGVTDTVLGTALTNDSIEEKILLTEVVKPEDFLEASQKITIKNYVLFDDWVGRMKENYGRYIVDRTVKINGTVPKKGDESFTYHSLYSFIPYLDKEGNFPLSKETNKTLKVEKLDNKIREIHLKNAIKTAIEDEYGKGALKLEMELNRTCKNIEDVKKELNKIIKFLTRRHYKKTENFESLLREQIESLEKENYYVKYEGEKENTEAEKWKITIGEFNNCDNLLGIRGNYPLVIYWEPFGKYSLAKNPIVANGAVLSCSNGTQPSKLKVTSQKTVVLGKKELLQATQQDYKEGQNIAPFGTCNASKPEDCSKLISLSPWEAVSKKETISNKKIILRDSYCMCNKGGVIRIIDPKTENINAD